MAELSEPNKEIEIEGTKYKLTNEQGRACYPKMIYPDGQGKPGVTIASAEDEHKLNAKKPANEAYKEKPAGWQ